MDDKIVVAAITIIGVRRNRKLSIDQESIINSLYRDLARNTNTDIRQYIRMKIEQLETL